MAGRLISAPHRLPGSVAGALVLVLCGTVALDRHTADAGITATRLPAIPFQDGVVIEFATHQIAHGESVYWTRIDLLETGASPSDRPSWARYRYDMFGGERASRTAGIADTLDLETCGSLNPWWGPGTDDRRASCDLWLPADVFAALAAGESAAFEIDDYFRNDRGVTLRTTGRAQYRLTLDGREIDVDALVVESSAGDELWVLDEPANPLVLWSRVPPVYEWGVTSVWLHEAPAAETQRAVTTLPAPSLR